MSRVSSSSAQQQHTGNSVSVPREKIAMRAYEKWCQRGRPQGTQEQDWLEAERELQAEVTKTGQRR
jgi:hypothetical protein